MAFGSVAGGGRLAAMPLCAGSEGHVHPVGPKYDRAAEATRPPVPPVPRTVRAKPKASTRGYMARQSRKEAPHAELVDRSLTPLSQNRESRRPREESPFAHARRHCLSRERSDGKNQEFEMGPVRRMEANRSDHRLYTRSGSCPPASNTSVEAGGDGELPLRRLAGRVSPFSDSDGADARHARRSTLQRERSMAEAGVLGDDKGSARPVATPSAELSAAAPVQHLRRRMLAQENNIADKCMLRRLDNAETFGRIMGRRDASAPPAVRGEAGVSPSMPLDEVSYARKGMLGRDGVGAHDGNGFARVMGR